MNAKDAERATFADAMKAADFIVSVLGDAMAGNATDRDCNMAADMCAALSRDQQTPDDETAVDMVAAVLADLEAGALDGTEEEVKRALVWVSNAYGFSVEAI